MPRPRSLPPHVPRRQHAGPEAARPARGPQHRRQRLGGGAGIQADLKTFTALNVHGCSAITCVTAQNTLGVSRVDALPPEALTAQVEAVVSDLPVAALKTGMLLNRALIEATVAAMARLALVPRALAPGAVTGGGSGDGVPRRGGAAGGGGHHATIRAALLPLADLVTPNIHEARLLSGLAITGAAAMERAAERLSALGAAAALVKGAGLRGLRGCDVAWIDGRAMAGSAGPIDTPHTHGSGCTLSAAITAAISRGDGLVGRSPRQGLRGGWPAPFPGHRGRPGPALPLASLAARWGDGQ